MKAPRGLGLESPPAVCAPAEMDVWDVEAVERYLLDIQGPPSEEANHRLWVRNSVLRFLRTLRLVPPGGAGQQCLEVGSMPYTFTLLMNKFRQYDLTLVDFYSHTGREHRETVILPHFNERHEFVSALCDLEREHLTVPDGTFDGVLCCEVLEHLTINPVAVLAEVHRVLKPGGWLILTTPNVVSLENILNLLHGRNVYRPYDLVFGPTWRHNREYTAGEVADLLKGNGFTIDHLSVEDVAPPHYRPPLSQRIIRRILRALYKEPYGNQLYVRAYRGSTSARYYPPWLFERVDIEPVDPRGLANAQPDSRQDTPESRSAPTTGSMPRALPQTTGGRDRCQNG